MHLLNCLSCAIHNQPSLPSFRTPPVYTGELIGMAYLHSQTGDDAVVEQELDKEIDKAFGDSTLDEDDEAIETENDETVAMPDSGNEVKL